jgi:hypothetical protein
MQVRLDQVQASAESTLTIAAVVLSLACVYVGLLHAVLLLYGRSLRRSTLPHAAIAPAAAPPPKGYDGQLLELDLPAGGSARSKQ